MKNIKHEFVDCEEGRRLGCNTFCCRLLVRLKTHEMEPSDGSTAAKGFVDKDEKGYCVHINKETWMCENWDNRPEVCREYSCNDDPLLQTILKDGFTNIAEVAKCSVANPIPKEQHKFIPKLGEN